MSSSGQQGFDLDVYDVERIEVLRGPQGTLFGRNTIAGAVNVVLAKPINSVAFGGDIEASSFSSYLAQGYVNLPLIDNTLLARASISYRHDGGYIRDVGPAENTDDLDRLSGRVALRFTSGDVTIDATVLKGSDKQGIIRSVSTGVVTNPVIFTVGLTEGLDPAGLGFFPANRRNIDTDAPQTNERDYVTGLLNAQVDLGGVTAVILGGAQKINEDSQGDFDRTRLNAVTFVADGKSELYSIEARLQSDNSSDSSFNWMIGGAYNRDEIDTNAVTTFREDIFTLIGLPTFLAPFRITDLTTQLRVSTVAAFGSTDWRSPDRNVTVSASARYTRDRLKSRYIDESQAFGTGLPAGIDLQQSQTFSDFTPRLSIRYEPSDNFTAYATVSRGYKAGGFNPGAQFVPGSPASYGKESAWSYEAGVKAASTDRKIRVAASVYRMDWSDIQVNALFRGADLVARNFTQNAATARINGVEFEGSAELLPNFNLGWAIGYADGKFKDFTTAVDENGDVFDASGNRLPNSSKWNLSSSAEYGVDVSDQAQVFGRVEINYASGFFQTTQRRFDAGYFVNDIDYINLRAGFRGNRVSVVAFAENLGASKSVFAFEVNNFLAGIQAIVRPERYGVRLSLNY
ncbi:MAG: TonB-dependent receptor [Sphingopyxis sp.]|nr:TonB-dependent receptor [Sphingopyxis sp.]